MGRPKKLPKPPSARQILLRERAVRRMARQQRQEAKSEAAFQRILKRAEKAKLAQLRAERKAEREERRLNEADKSAHLAHLRKMREVAPDVLLGDTLKLRDLAKTRSEFLRELARRLKANSDLSEPEELQECRQAELAARTAEGEFQGLRVQCIRLRKGVDAAIERSESERLSLHLAYASENSSP